MGKPKPSIWVAIFIYILIVLVDLGFNVVAIFIPALGGIAESLTEIVLEMTAFIVVLFIAFAGGK